MISCLVKSHLLLFLPTHFLLSFSSRTTFDDLRPLSDVYLLQLNCMDCLVINRSDNFLPFMTSAMTLSTYKIKHKFPGGWVDSHDLVSFMNMK